LKKPTWGGFEKPVGAKPASDATGLQPHIYAAFSDRKLRTTMTSDVRLIWAGVKKTA